MGKVRIIYKPDGSVGIIHPAPKSKRKDETEEQWLKRVFDKATPEDVEYEDVEDSKIPQDREFRDAWIGKKGEGISIDEVKKQEIINAKNKIS